MMVAAVSTPVNSKTTTRRQNISRPPLLPSEPDNALAPACRPKSREVAPRYLSSSSSSSSATPKRSASPSISRPAAAMMHPATPSANKRSQSVERQRRPATPLPNSLDLRVGNGSDDVSNTQKLLTTSTRSLSVSFQGESFSFQVSKSKPAPSPVSSTRKGTPERKKPAPALTPMPARGSDHVENSRPLDQHRWPARSRQPNLLTTKNGDFGTEDRKKSVVTADADVRSSIESSLSSDPINLDSVTRFNDPETDSVSSGSSASEGITGGTLQRAPRGIAVPARFWQETNNRLRRQTEPSSPVAKANGLQQPQRKLIKKVVGIGSPVSSPKGAVNTRGQLSPIHGATQRPASPSKFGGTPSPALFLTRGLSPARSRSAVGGLVNGNLSTTPSILSFAADIRRVKNGESRIGEVHILRLLYNRLLQWRFVNSRASAALSAQRLNAEKSLHNARVTTSKLRESVRAKRIELQWLRQNLKLISILKGQMLYLEEWALVDEDYLRSLSGAIEALRASTLRLPVVGGARADVQNVKDAICSAVDVLQAMASSICLLLSKVEKVNLLVVELANVAAKEHTLLDQSKDLLSTIAALEVTECSLITHVLQLKHIPA